MPDVWAERLSLRRFRLDDLDELVPIFAKPEVWAYPYGLERVVSVSPGRRTVSSLTNLSRVTVR